MKKGILAVFLVCGSLNLNAQSENFMKALALLDQKKYEEAVTAFTLALKDSPSEAFFWERRGYALYCLKKHYEAINSYTMAIILSPNIPILYCQRSLAYFETGNNNAMINDLTTAARLGEPNAQKFLNKNNISWREE